MPLIKNNQFFIEKDNAAQNSFVPVTVKQGKTFFFKAATNSAVCLVSAASTTALNSTLLTLVFGRLRDSFLDQYLHVGIIKTIITSHAFVCSVYSVRVML